MKKNKKMKEGKETQKPVSRQCVTQRLYQWRTRNNKNPIGGRGIGIEGSVVRITTHTLSLQLSSGL